MLVVVCNMVPIGVVEVKKPDVDGNPTARLSVWLSNAGPKLLRHESSVWYTDYARDLPCVLAAFSFGWHDSGCLSKSGLIVDQVHNPRKGQKIKQNSPPGYTPSKWNPVYHDVLGKEKSANRLLHVSQIYRREDRDHLAIRAVAAALCKIMVAKPNHFNDPFDKGNRGVCSCVAWAI